jgi:hypothetical protein
VLSLFMIYIDSKSITACIVVNDRQLSMNVPKYLASIADSLNSVQNSAPALLRGNQKADTVRLKIQTLNETYSYRQNNNESAYELLTQNLSLNITNNGISSEDLQERDIEQTKAKKIEYTGQSETQFEAISEEPIESVVEQIKQTKDKQREEVGDTFSGNNRKWDHSESLRNIEMASKNEVTIDIASNKSTESNQNPTKTNTKESNHESSLRSPAKVLCLSGEPYGRTMNQYLQLATILHQLGINNTTVVAFKNPLFTSFYKTWFEPRDDIIVSYDDDAPCDAEYDAVTLHYLFFKEKWKPVAYQFETLIPKASIREEAERVMKEYAGPSNLPVTTVHRRDLEGACVLFAEQKNLIACPNIRSSQELSVIDYKNACLIDYPMISNATEGTNVVLFTDGQVPELDETFPTISKHKFHVQAWMMAISDVHYGNPFSTVDVVVYFWRMALSRTTGSNNIEMRPTACYKPTPEE